MQVEEVKQVFHDLTVAYFSKATVLWTYQMNTTQKYPYVTLKAGDLKRSSRHTEDKDWNRAFHCTLPIEVNLYTQGRRVRAGQGSIGNYIDTAVSDLNDFVNFLESEYGRDRLAHYRIAVSLDGDVRDLTALQNDESQSLYRAMVEIRLDFEQEAGGAFGNMEMLKVPNSSGGGSKEFSDRPIDDIAAIEVKSQIMGAQEFTDIIYAEMERSRDDD